MITGVVGSLMGAWTSNITAQGNAAVSNGTANILAGMAKNAAGGVYASPSLSAYSGGVYDSPRVFAFANGIGVFGEAGPEAIMPLKRLSNGKLGVQATGGGSGSIQVEINNYGNNKVEAQERTQKMPDGTEMRKLVLNIVADDIASGGRVATAGKSRFGWKEQV